MSEHSTRKDLDTAKPPRPTRAQRLAAAGFLGAFGLTILTLLLTGLKVGAPAARHVLNPVPVAAGSSAHDARAEKGPASTSAVRSAAAVPTAPAAPASNGEAQTTGDAARPDTDRDRAARQDVERDRADAARNAARKKGDAAAPPVDDAR